VEGERGEAGWEGGTRGSRMGGGNEGEAEWEGGTSSKGEERRSWTK
jgi:hypothetical protein